MHAVADGGLAGPHSRSAVDDHHALEAAADAAVKSARCTTTAGRPQGPLADREQGRGDALAIVGAHQITVDDDLDGIAALDSVIHAAI